MPSVISSSRPAAFKRGPIAKPRSLATRRSGERFATSSNARIPGRAAARANTAQPLRNEHAIVVIERNHIGNRAERNQIEIIGEIGFSDVLLRKPIAFTQFSAQRAQHVKNNTDTREVFAGKTATRLIRIDDARGCRNLLSRQMVIGNQHANAE